MKTLILGLAALLLAACQAEDSNAFKPGAGFRPGGKYEHQFELAAAEWCRKTQDEDACRIRLDPSGYSIVHKRSAASWTRGPSVGATTSRPDDASLIEVIDTLDQPTAYKVLLHELGHHLGCEHSQDPGDTMFPQVTDNAELSDNDVACATE